MQHTIPAHVRTTVVWHSSFNRPGLIDGGPGWAATLITRLTNG